MSTVPYKPAGTTDLVPYLTVSNAAAAIDFYIKAFGAVERSRSAAPDGRVMHSQLVIGDSVLMVSDDFSGGSSREPAQVTMHLYVADVDAVAKRAVEHGAKISMPVADQFWGDRYGRLLDPFGHSWSVSTQKKLMTQAEQDAAGQEFMAAMSRQAPPH